MRAAALAALVSPAAIGADLFDHYGGVVHVVTPPPTAPGSFGVAADALPDGRLVALTGSTVFVETGVGAGVFAPAAILGASLLAGPTDPGFIRVSPGGTRVAIGAGFGLPIIVFDAAALDPLAPTTLTPANAARFEVGHFDAAWLDETRLAIAAGAFGSPSIVTMLDVTSDPSAPVNPVIVSNIAGASGGVAFDSDGALYTGNGFDLTPATPRTSRTGAIKRFTPGEWSAGADFETGGRPVLELLSAGPLAFDADGDLLVGGGDFAQGQTGFVGVVRAGVLAGVIAGPLTVNPNNPAHVRRLDPIGDGSGFLGARAIRATDELLITGGPVWFTTSGRRPGDATGDGLVTGADLTAVLNAFSTTNRLADLTGDGVVNGADLTVVLNSWTGAAP
ncbi:MAG: hypothetical protein D6693_07740 [Planctomycetota bacterium]|nr:MAG: hypothetical protein D6693_07740 [Planctomycetota bacterium]